VAVHCEHSVVASYCNNSSATAWHTIQSIQTNEYFDADGLMSRAK